MSKRTGKGLTRSEFLNRCLRCSVGIAAAPAALLSGGEARAQERRRGFVSPREALYYQKLDNGYVLCELCPHFCVVGPDERGSCGVRLFRDGQYVTLVHGNPCAVHVDPIEKKPLLHFLPGSRAFSLATAGCNLHCRYCQNWEISQRRPEETDNIDLPPEKVIDQALRAQCDSIAYTYSDPNIFYEYVMDCATLARERGVKNVLVTAGYINPAPQRQLCQVVDAANVDLKGFTESFYQEICAGKLKPVLDALIVYREEGVWLEVTNLILPSLNDDLATVRRMCQWISRNLGDEVPLHFSRFHPRYKLKNLPATPLETLENMRAAALDVGLKNVYVGNVPSHEGENTYCPRCGRLVIGRVGYTVTGIHLLEGSCQHCGQEIAGVWENL